MTDTSASDERADDAGRKLFRYVVGDEWEDYRAIMDVFAGTFFSEFSPDDVATRLASSGRPLDPMTVGDRLESLRRWGNLTVSSAVGSPTSLADYYKRRNRYLITRAGQEVHQLVEGVLTHVDEVRDIATGRLRALLAALDALAGTDVDHADPVALADLVGAVFDPHAAFTSEITQFFAAINQWQSRYDLTPEEFSFFADVLVGYVAERLDEIERTSRPIGHRLAALAGSVPTIVERANRGLAARVEVAGLEGNVAVTSRAGSRAEDWDHLRSWFVGGPARPSRIEQLGREAVAAIRTLTLNLTRLSRVGIGASSRRADFLRLARFFSCASSEDAPGLAVAAFGLQATNHYGVPAEDADDPVSTATPWSAAPRAPVPVSLRERGDTTNRGRPSPVTDRTQAQRLVRARRERERDLSVRVDRELLDHASLDGASLTAAAFTRLQDLIGRTLSQLDTRGRCSERHDGLVVCTVERTPGRHTAVASPAGVLTLHDLTVSVRPGPEHDRAERSEPTVAADPQAPLEQQLAARHLVQRPLTCKEHDPEVFRLVRRHEAALDRWFTQRLGYRLHVDADTARLLKTGFVPARRPLRTATGRPFTRLEYVLLALALASTAAGPPVTSLRDLVEQVRSAAAEADVALADGPSERRALVTALQWMIAWGLAAEVHAHVGAYATDDTADAVLRVRPDRIALLPLPALVSAATPDGLLDRAERRAPTRVWMRSRLVEDPVVYRDTLTDGEWGELRRRLGEEERTLHEMFGLLVESRAEGVAAIDPTGSLAERRFPAGGTVGHCALLLIEAWRPNEASAPSEGVAVLPWDEVVVLVAALAAEHARRWAKELVSAPDRLARQVVDLLVDLHLARHVPVPEADGDGDAPVGVQLLPAAARFLPVLPPDDADDADHAEAQAPLW